MSQRRTFIILAVILNLICILTLSQHSWAQSVLNPIRQRLVAEGELAPLPEAKDLLNELAKTIESSEFKEAIKDSRSLQMMRNHLRTSLFHLNLKFETPSEPYPYDTPFKAPLPFRPTVEALDEAIQFLQIVEDTVGYKTQVKNQLINAPYFEDLQVLFKPVGIQDSRRVYSKSEIIKNPVDTYIELQERLERHGEIASFPEFSEAVEGVLTALNTPEARQFEHEDKAFAAALKYAMAALVETKNPNGGEATAVDSGFGTAYPYRRTFQAIMRGVAVLDMLERLKYPEVTNWHEVELSWYHGEKRKLLGLYHFNRYKYQLFGLLADPEVVMWPFYGDASTEDIIRLRAAPWGISGVYPVTLRADRHFNSPEDFGYHDINHARRMWGYDKRKQQRLGAKTKQQKIAIYREQERFLDDLLSKTAMTLNPAENEIRKKVHMLIFETVHETALTPDPVSLINDILRRPGTRQPFEVQVQAQIDDLEDIRTFDGNLRSGADQLSLDFTRPTIIRYFYDRAPGYLANVDNKLRWGFYDSAFEMNIEISAANSRTPSALAKAATRLLQLLGQIPPSHQELLNQIKDRTGQPELYNYYSNRDVRVVTDSDINSMNLVSADVLHANWRRITTHTDRWKPAYAKLRDGTRVISPGALEAYLDEKQVPSYLRRYFKIDTDPVTKESILFEDLKNLPQAFLASNHQDENMMSGAKAVSIVDRIWQKKLKFRSLDQAERWLIAACQAIHQGVLDRNTNGSRNNSIYNQHWILLPAQNKKNDLDVLRIAYEARVKTDPASNDQEQVTLMDEAVMRLYTKIASNAPLNYCSGFLSNNEFESEN